MTRSNEGPCSITGCNNPKPYRKFTVTSYNKSVNNGTFSYFDYLRVNESQLCNYHHLQICEPIKGKKLDSFESQDTNETFQEIHNFTFEGLLNDLNDEDMMLIDISFNDINVNITDDAVTMSNSGFTLLLNKIYQMQKQIDANKKLPTEETIEPVDRSFSMQVQRMTKILFAQQRQQNEKIELNPQNFQNMLTEQDPLLEGFFEEMTDALIPEKRSDNNKESAKKSVVSFCYLLAGFRNKFANSIKLDIGLYLASSGTSSNAINTLANAGICANYKTIARVKKQIAKDHFDDINEYFKTNVSTIFYYIIFIYVF
jgi:hypothetical protein